VSGLLIAITGVLYAGVALDQMLKHQPFMAMVYAGYAFSNVGFFLLVTKNV
jgi:hypothetical protein